MPARVRLRPFEEAELPGFRDARVHAFAAAITEATGQSRDDALARSYEMFDRLMPAGLRTQGMRVLHVMDEDGTDVGFLWTGPHPQRHGARWVYNVEIDEQHRGQGLGRATMQAAEDLAVAEGAEGIGLNVFETNTRARALYESMGYTVESVQMGKPLPADPEDAR